MLEEQKMETEEQTCFLPCSAIGEVTSCRIETFSALYVMMIMMVIMVLRMETLLYMETKGDGHQGEGYGGGGRFDEYCSHG